MNVRMLTAVLVDADWIGRGSETDRVHLGQDAELTENRDSTTQHMIADADDHARVSDTASKSRSLLISGFEHGELVGRRCIRRGAEI
jgi:hypothetical protein